MDSRARRSEGWGVGFWAYVESSWSTQGGTMNRLAYVTFLHDRSMPGGEEFPIRSLLCLN